MPKKCKSTTEKSATEAVVQPDPELEKRRKNRHIRLSAWVQASRIFGFLQKNQKFNTIPKKGTPEHAAIKEAYNKLVSEWLEAGDVPEEFKRKEEALADQVVKTEKVKRKRRAKKSADEPKQKRAKKAVPTPSEAPKTKKAKKPKKPKLAVQAECPPTETEPQEPPTPRASSTPKLIPSPTKPASPKSPKSPKPETTTESDE
jgi:hypothetical protein